jgi:hypothetical protein
VGLGGASRRQSLSALPKRLKSADWSPVLQPGTKRAGGKAPEGRTMSWGLLRLVCGFSVDLTQAKPILGCVASLMPRLVLLSEGYTGRTYELKTERTTIGRLEDNTFQIPDGSVSGHHCELILQGNEVLVRDLHSTNGTFINGERITEGVLKPGQILRLGLIEMRLETGEPAAPKRQVLEKTIVIPQGVKITELERPRTTSLEGKTGFEKKSNRGRLFIIAAAVVGLILVVLLIIVAAGGFKP